MSLFAYLQRMTELQQFRAQGYAYNPVKASRAQYLGQLDRQLTPEEWEEFKQLVKEGF